MRRLRIIPLTMATALLLLVVKTIDVVRGTEELSEALLISRVQAEQAEEKPAEAAPAEAKPEEKPKEKTEEKPAAEEKKPDEKKPEEKKGEEKKEGKGEKSESGGEGKPSNPNVSETLTTTADRAFSKVELELLQSLAKRRDELDRWEKNIQVKEATLDATEKRINEKIDQIEAMKKAVSELLEQYNMQEDTKIKSLVKIYENMKPKDAARIFDELEMPILLLLVDKMAEKKASPILALMNPLKAKQLTVELAEERRINTERFNKINSRKIAKP